MISAVLTWPVSKASRRRAIGKSWKREKPTVARREKAREVYHPRKGTRRKVKALLSWRVEKRPRAKEMVQRRRSLLLVFHTCLEGEMNK